MSAMRARWLPAVFAAARQSVMILQRLDRWGRMPYADYQCPGEFQAYRATFIRTPGAINTVGLSEFSCVRLIEPSPIL